MTKRIRDPRLDPRPGDVVRNRKNDPQTRTVVNVYGDGSLYYTYRAGLYGSPISIADWREFGRGGEVIKRAK